MSNKSIQSQKRNAAFLNGDTVKMACLSNLLTDLHEVVGTHNPKTMSLHINTVFQSYLETCPPIFQRQVLDAFGSLHAINTMLAANANFLLDNAHGISDELNVLIG